jgi:hypothetical protein
VPLHGFRNIGFIGGGFSPLEATSSATITTYTQDNVVYTVHSFTTPGTFNFNIVKLGSLKEVDYLIVAGGGGGGAADNQEEAGSGGGAGGLREGVFKLTEIVSIPIVVGGAGAGGTGGNSVTPRAGSKGGNSSFSNIISAGGGGGLAPRAGDANRVSDGGSGGGGTARSETFGLGNIPSTSPSQGTNGAQGSGGFLISGLSTNGGGGGGANGSGSSNATGGAGRSLSIGGTSITYSKGGNGGVRRTRGTLHLATERGSGGAGAGAQGEPSGDPNQFHPPGSPGINGVVILRYVKEFL